MALSHLRNYAKTPHPLFSLFSFLLLVVLSTSGAGQGFSPSEISQVLGGGLHSSVQSVPKFQISEAVLYYDDSSCRAVVEEALKPFGSVISLEDEKKISDPKKLQNILSESLGAQQPQKELPALIIKGAASLTSDGGASSTAQVSVVISGDAACSSSALKALLCRYLPSEGNACAQGSVAIHQANVISPSLEQNACYSQCLSEYETPQTSLGYVFHAQISRTSLCAQLQGYSPDTSVVISRNCLDKKSCASDEKDNGCCAKDQCVAQGKCYAISSSFDVDGNGQAEICSEIENANHPAWTNPDASEQVCSSHFAWIPCQGKCGYGVSEYKKNKGLCCGDDGQEKYLLCEGAFCNESDSACCPEGSCVYAGKCHKSGCTSLEGTEGKFSAFCEEGKWQDLDVLNCAKCLGKSHVAADSCCGDDAREGSRPRSFIFHKTNETVSSEYSSCTSQKNTCIIPQENKEYLPGCYQFSDNPFLKGGYFCHGSEWYDLDTSKKYCASCGNTFLSECCGDDPREYVVTGTDGTKGCCKKPTDDVFEGKCVSTYNCGNGRIDRGEKCEEPQTLDNGHCSQQNFKCFGNMLGTRDSRGDCDDSCQCTEDEYSIACTKGECGATCSNDDDCASGFKCDPNSCGCVRRSFCGDGLIDEKNDDGWKEDCELPNTILNPSCNQQSKCFNLHTGIQYFTGSCDENCLCSYRPYELLCIKGSCGAECNQDGSGCPEGESCDPGSCECTPSDVACGDGKCSFNEIAGCPKDCVEQGCPYRVDLILDKESYSNWETVEMRVVVYDLNNTPIPFAPFSLDTVTNEAYVTTRSYKAGPDGTSEERLQLKASTQVGQYEYLSFIAKSQQAGCSIVGDTSNVVVYYTEPPISANSFKPFLNLQAFILSICGNGEVEAGEACEGGEICRYSTACNYRERSYDFPESCAGCKCPKDIMGTPDDPSYCINCKACGDGVVNCNEECESGESDFGVLCRNDDLYKRVDSCTECRLYDDGDENDVLMDSCYCACPPNPNEQCANGNYANYPESYEGGCGGGACNPCNCADTYTKDRNGDGIEDKCSKEICTNGIDDNDNGKTDLEDEECSLCQYCGYGLDNGCDRNECGAFLQGCYFSQSFWKFGRCATCNAQTSCESYGDDRQSCEANLCGLNGCDFLGGSCCTDKDGDEVCDSKDNCPSIANPQQQDTDKDGAGDFCDACSKEPRLVYPTEREEESCDDGVDNDCDDTKDCEDADCAGISGCCQTTKDCEGKQCSIENCLNNRCSYQSLPACSSEDCPQGSYCNSAGSCEEAARSYAVCIDCVNDRTPHDSGLGYGLGIFALPSQNLCCGDGDDEYYVVDSKGKADACCSEEGSCVDEMRLCHAPSSLKEENSSLLCAKSKWQDCSPSSNLLCAEAGSGYTSSYARTGEIGIFCTFDGSNWHWSAAFPQERCTDGTDNDCDGRKDGDDPDCERAKNLTGVR